MTQAKAPTRKAPPKSKTLARSKTPEQGPTREFTYCDCAGCSRQVLGDSWREWYQKQLASERRRFHGVVSGRILDRPYCGDCLRTKAKPVKQPPQKAARKGEPSPAQENAVRHMEDRP